MSTPRLALRLMDCLRPFLDLRCLGGRLYLGSMFYLDFGELFIATSSKGERIQIGEMTLSIRDTAWWLKNRAEIVASAEGVDSKTFEKIANQLTGLRLVDVIEAASGEQIEIKLENEWLLIVDIGNQWESDSDIVQISLPDGRVVAVTEKGVLDQSAGFDAERARNWATAPRHH